MKGYVAYHRKIKLPRYGALSLKTLFELTKFNIFKFYFKYEEIKPFGSWKTPNVNNFN